MSQYNQSAPTTAASDGGYAGAQGVSRGPSTASSAGFAGRGTANAYASMPNSAPPMPTIPDAYSAPAGMDGTAPGLGLGAAVGAGAGAAAAGSAMNPKQREAYQESQRFRVQNQGYGNGAGPGASGSGSGAGAGAGGQPMSPIGSDGSAGNVTVHEDAGAFNPEIPPT